MTIKDLAKLHHDDKDDDNVITDKDSDVRTIKGIKYRRAFNYSNDRQADIYHYIIDQEYLKKIRINNVWYVEIKPHRCHLHCIDSGDTSTTFGNR
jgi:hypothetical protein